MKYATPRYQRNGIAGAHFGGRSINGSKFGLNRALLPNPIDYLKMQGLNPKGSGLWRDLVCPFHDDTSPSLRINSDKGGFKCMACGAKGGDVIAFHMQLKGIGFVEACKQLGVWEQK